MKCYRKNGSDVDDDCRVSGGEWPSMKCYRKNGSDGVQAGTISALARGPQ